MNPGGASPRSHGEASAAEFRGRPHFTGGGAGEPQRLRSAGHGGDPADVDRGLGRSAPAGVHGHWTDATWVRCQYPTSSPASSSGLIGGTCSGSQRQSVGDPDRRHVKHSAQLQRQPDAARMIAPGGNDHNVVRQPPRSRQSAACRRNQPCRRAYERATQRMGRYLLLEQRDDAVEYDRQSGVELRAVVVARPKNVLDRHLE